MSFYGVIVDYSSYNLRDCIGLVYSKQLNRSFAKHDYTLRLANGMANPSVCPSVVSVVCDVRAPYSGV